jgi:hypothetical protein
MTTTKTTINFQAMRSYKGTYIHIETVIALLHALLPTPELAKDAELEVRRLTEQALSN